MTQAVRTSSMPTEQADIVRHYAGLALERYCGGAIDRILQLPVANVLGGKTEPLPPKLEYVPLPAWATDIGIDGALLVPSHLIAAGDAPAWELAAWFDVIAWFLHGAAERVHEDRHGSVHSFAYRLRGWPEEMWNRAWVNRISLFLRRWAARANNVEEARMFGSLPEAEIRLTHDVDYVSKTWDFRVKQAVHGGRSCLSGPISEIGQKAQRMMRMAFYAADYHTFDALMALEDKYGVRSVIHFFGGLVDGRRTAKEMFIDPGYDVCAPKLVDAIRKLRDGGWTIGLHQGSNSWQSGSRMATEKKRVEQAAVMPVTHCRQHWLKFSWQDTWAAQSDAGFTTDATLGFNDKPGFRSGAALAVHPWHSERHGPLPIDALPLVVMDSQIRNFAAPNGGMHEIVKWITEIRAVGGVGTVTWHPHTLHADFADAECYEDVLRLVS